MNQVDHEKQLKLNVAPWSYAGGTESYSFDNLDRVTQITNPLGTFVVLPSKLDKCHCYSGGLLVG